jgi:hypothetical protein
VRKTPDSPPGARADNGLNQSFDWRSTLSFILFVILAIIWVALAFWPARVAARKGHSFLGYFIFSLFLWPVALIVAYVVEDRAVVA